MKVTSVNTLVPVLVAFSEGSEIAYVDFLNREIYSTYDFTDEIKKEILERLMGQQANITVPEDLKDSAMKMHDEVLHGSKQA